jgi:uncharacterized RmlC-like cupin family protein
MNSAATQPAVRILESMPDEFSAGVQGQLLAPVVHSGIAPVKALSAGLVRMPGGHESLPHVHEHSEIIVHIVRGLAASLVGETMTPVLHTPGSLIYIADGIPHAALNLYPHTTDPAQQEVSVCTACETRTDKAFNDDVLLRPDLDELVAEQAARLRAEFRRGLLDARLDGPRVNVVTR